MKKLKAAVTSVHGSWDDLVSGDWYVYVDKEGGATSIAKLMSAMEQAMSRFEEDMQLYGQKYADMHSKFENLNKTIASIMQIMADIAQSITRNI